MLEEISLDSNWLISTDPPEKGDAALYVRFYLHPKQDPVETAKQGRPIFNDVEYVQIGAPGDRLNEIHRPATIKDKRRFRRQYQAFKEGQKDVTQGTPLSKWPLITAAQVEELKYFHVRSVEQLAMMPDGNIPNVGNISHLKKLANDYLAAAKGEAVHTQLRSELEKRDQMLEAMQRQMAEMQAQVTKQAARQEARDEADAIASADQKKTKK